MRGGLLFALLLVTTPVAESARADDVIGDLIQAAENQPDPAPSEDRRRPGRVEQPQAPQAIAPNPNAVRAPPPEAFPTDQLPIPDRWRLVEAIGVHSRWFDPYNQNTIKGDRPIRGTKDWFFTLTGVSDTLIEPRSFPLPVGAQTTERPGSNDNFGRATSVAAAQTVIVGLALTKGSTAFKPPEIEAHLTLAFNANYAQVPEKRILSISPSNPTHRRDSFLGVQEAFIDYHIRNVSERYDFDSIRVGIQPFSSDFRGFLFQDNAVGVRLFGDRGNNRYQYNLGWFRRVEKDTNSGLNDFGQPLRRDDVYVANLYIQDMPVHGFTSQFTVLHNRNYETEQHYNTNGFLVRPTDIGFVDPHRYSVTYL